MEKISAIIPKREIVKIAAASPLDSEHVTLCEETRAKVT
jgi:hypothetical protein